MPSHLGPSLSFSDSYISIFLLCSYLCCSKSWNNNNNKNKKNKKENDTYPLPISSTLYFVSFINHTPPDSWLLIHFISPKSLTNKRYIHSLINFSLLSLFLPFYLKQKEKKKYFFYYLFTKVLDTIQAPHFDSLFVIIPFQ